MRATLERLARRAEHLGARRCSSGLPSQVGRHFGTSFVKVEVKTMVEALNRSLYEEFGLEGNQADYYNPATRRRAIQTGGS